MSVSVNKEQRSLLQGKSERNLASDRIFGDAREMKAHPARQLERVN
jgi:hypothetical protein